MLIVKLQIMKRQIHLFLLTNSLLLLSGCYYWSGILNNPQAELTKRKNIYHYDYLERDKSQDEFINFIIGNYLADLEQKIAKEHIVLPSVAITEFTNTALVEKTKDVEFQKTDLGKSSKRNNEELTKLVVTLLQRINLFQSIQIDNSSKDIIVKPSFGVYKDHSYSLGPVAFPVALLTFGIISPISSKEIISINFVFLSGESVVAKAEGVGGGYTYLSTVWMEDNPRVYSRMQRNAFGIALRNLILNIIEQRDNLKKKI